MRNGDLLTTNAMLGTEITGTAKTVVGTKTDTPAVNRAAI